MFTNIRIAIQGKGRLSEPSIDFLSSLGLNFNPNGRNCLVTCANSNLDILFLRDDDIPEYVERGVSDFGIVGENVLLEKRARVNVLRKLGFGQCSLVIAAPKNSRIKRLGDLEEKRIATSYPDLLKQFLQNQRIEAEIIKIKGSAEIAPRLDLADAICDLTQTGITLEENGLMPIATVLESQAVLIQTPYPMKEKTRQYEVLFTKSVIASTFAPLSVNSAKQSSLR